MTELFYKHPYLTAYLIFHFYGIITVLLATVYCPPYGSPYTAGWFFATGTVLAPIFAFAGIFGFPHVAIPYFAITYGFLYYYVNKRRADVENVV